MIGIDRKPLARFLAVLVRAAVLLLTCGLGAGVHAQDSTVPSSPYYVTDNANAVQEEDLEEPNRVLFALEQRTQIEFRVLLVPTTGGLSVQEYSQNVFRDWRIGARSGKGLLFLVVTRGLSWQLQISADLNGELPISQLTAFGQQAANEIRQKGYGPGLRSGLKILVDEVGRSRNLDYTTLASQDIVNVPPRPENPPRPVPLLVLLKLAFGIAISVMGILVGFGLGVSFIRTLFFFRQENETHGRFRTTVTRGFLFAVCAALVYHFWSDITLYLGIGRLFGQVLAIFGACLFPIFAIFAFLLLVYLIKHASRHWDRYVRAGRQVTNRPILIGLGLPLLLLLLPRSEVSTLRSWQNKTGPMIKTSNAGPGWLGPSLNGYTVDNLGRVRALQLYQTNVHSLKELPGIEDLSSLEILDIRDVPLEGVLDVSSLVSLKSLRFSQTHLTGLVGLEQLSELEELQIDHIDIDTLSGLTQLSKLKILSLTACKIGDLSKIGTLSNLEMLFLDGTDVSDVSPLSELGKLWNLSLVNTAVSDVTALKHLPLSFLHVRESQIADEKLRQTFSHPVLIIRGDIPLARGLLSLEEEFLSPETKRIRNYVLLFLAAIGLGLWAFKSLGPLNKYDSRLLRTLFGSTVWGVVIVLILLTLANLKLPVSIVSNNGLLPDAHQLLLSWALVIAILWLGVRPLLILGLETKHLNASRWCVVVTLLNRFMPVIAVFGPVSYKVIINSLPSNFYFLTFFSFFMTLALFGWPWFLALIVLAIAAGNWRRKFRVLRDSTIAGSGLIVEVPLRLTNRNIISRGVRLVRLSPTSAPDTAAVSERQVVTVPSVATLSRLPAVGNGNVLGSVLTIRRHDLRSLRRWEVRAMQQWAQDLYVSGWSPIWLIVDWFETETNGSNAIGRNLAKLDSLLPFLNGTEQRFKIGVSVFPLQDNEGLQKCLAANELMPRDHLESLSFNQILQEAFTPAAVLLRNVFGHAQLVDRMDLLARATEVSVVFFSLALMAEFDPKEQDLSEPDREKLNAGIKRTFRSAPTFGEWISLLLTFTKRGKTELALRLREALDKTPLEATVLFRQLLENVAGAPLAIGESINKKSQTLVLLQQMRNLITAHGPIIESASPDLYRLALMTTVNLLSSLPWTSTKVCSVAGEECELFQGLVTTKSKVTTASNGVFVQLETSGSKALISAEKYFRHINGSIALYIGEDGYFDPLTGLRV
jgi:uncharacterized membrane protein YgcG/Leucine-rich repeat (LRR) protein